MRAERHEKDQRKGRREREKEKKVREKRKEKGGRQGRREDGGSSAALDGGPYLSPSKVPSGVTPSGCSRPCRAGGRNGPTWPEEAKQLLCICKEAPRPEGRPG